MTRLTCNEIRSDIGGGVLIYIDNHVNYKRRHELETPNIESVWALMICLWSSPPGFNCWTSIAPAFQNWLGVEYLSCFISVMMYMFAVLIHL